MEALPNPESLGFMEIVVRFLIAMAVGMIIGTEREYSNRPAGMRTHILVALGACAVMVTSQQIYIQYHMFGANPDPARLPAQVITGVGFLGAGTIMREGVNVKGLTTAASLWTVACLGVAAGGGYYMVALAGMAFVFLTLTVVEVFQHRLIGPSASLRRASLETANLHSCLEALNRHAKARDVNIREITSRKMSDESFQVRFHFSVSGFDAEKRRQSFLELLTTDPSVISIHLYAPSAEGAAGNNTN